MALTIACHVSRDMLGAVTDAAFGMFQDELLDALRDEWPDAEVTVEEGEEQSIEVSGVPADAEKDVRDRIDDILDEVLEAGEWSEEDQDEYDEESELDEDEEEDEDDR